MDEITKKIIQDWILIEEKAGRSVDIGRINLFANLLMKRHNNAPRDEYNGLSPEELHNTIYFPFSSLSIVTINKLNMEQYEKIPLVRQTLFLLNTLNEKELKLTKLGWLPLKIVAATYRLGQPEYIIEEFGQKRINEYEVNSVWMARIILESLGWVKTRKGILSLTIKGKKSLTNIEKAADEILYQSLDSGLLHTFDGYKDSCVGNYGIAYSLYLLHIYGAEWHLGSFYLNHYNAIFNFSEDTDSYDVRVFKRLFYWLGIVEQRDNKQPGLLYEDEYRRTGLLSMIFSFKK